MTQGVTQHPGPRADLPPVPDHVRMDMPPFLTTSSGRRRHPRSMAHEAATVQLSVALARTTLAQWPGT